MGLKRIVQKLKLRYGSQETVINTLREMGVQIGTRCRIYSSNFGGEPWLIRIGDHVCISNDVLPRITISPGPFRTSTIR